MNFTTLCKQLELETEYRNFSQLQKLEQWCGENISQDLRFSGSETVQYQKYFALARIYLDTFCSRIPKELSQMDAIYEAAHKGYDRYLFNLKPSHDMLNKANLYSFTPLHIAAIYGNFHTVSTLLSLGADATIANKHQQLPIFSSLMLPVICENPLKANRIKSFELLRDALPQTLLGQDSNGDTVLHLMTIHGLSDLVEDVLKTNNELAYIANNQTHYPIHTAILNNHAQCAGKLLQAKGVSILKDSKDRAALHYAARYRGKDMVALCCEFTPDLNLRDIMGKTPLLMAAGKANLEAMEILVQRGARADLTDTQGQTVLHFAVKSGDVRAVLWVLDHLAIDINVHDKHHQSPLSLCDEYHKEVHDLLIEKGAIARTVSQP